MANLRRCELAKETASFCDGSLSIIALSGMRPISESEKDIVNTYAPDAKTEFDAICMGMKKVFDDISEEKNLKQIILILIYLSQ